MATLAPLLRDDPLTHLEPAAVVTEWTRRGLDQLGDAELTSLCAAHVAVPRVDPADSFVLHAPLELLARSALLRAVDPSSRQRTRQRMVWLATTYDRYEPIADDPPRSAGSATTITPIERLRGAIAAGDLDDVDRASAELVRSTTAAELVRALADVVVDRLSAAGHGSIFLYHLPRLLAADPAAASMARGLLREIGRNPSWAVAWMDERPRGTVPTHDLSERLLGPPSPGDPGSNFIHPTMSLVERSGLAATLLAEPTLGLRPADALRVLTRLAAWSMLQDDPAHAPYGWSHALTMPQATIGIAEAVTDPDRAVAVAATYLLGFRSTLSSTVLDPAWEPPVPRGIDHHTFLDAGPDLAAAAVWHASDTELGLCLRRVVAMAAQHSDAHLAKYTVACLDASRDDPASGRLYLAAAAFLAGWWKTRAADDDLFVGVD